MDWILDPAVWAAFLTLTALEIILGVDNVIFISVISERLPASERTKARWIGLALAFLLRVALLFAITWIIALTAPIITAFGVALSWRDMILIGGGLFLLTKATLEIHHAIEGDAHGREAAATSGFAMAIAQIAALDLVFSLDSVITAVGMVEDVRIMIAALIVAILVMAVSAGPVSRFVAERPTAKMLALSFLLLIGVALMADGLHAHIPRGYLYFAIAFSASVECLNTLRTRSKSR